MGKKSSATVMIDGTINSGDIFDAHTKIKEIVESYKLVNKRVNSITKTVNENWVGKGQTEFESQYNLLIKKIDDFGDTLQDIYNALVKAEAAYEEQDDNLRKDFVKAVSS
ncbi:MAG: WXG100 family type VII secretion target [Lachnospira sp.]